MTLDVDRVKKRPSEEIQERSDKLFIDWYRKLPPSLRHSLDTPDFMRQAILEYLDAQAGFPKDKC